ncbi:hypothetical protein Syun_018515 [Stephania yunnanensis]|uniref:Cationic amino acid transporter n=1 Tax=Stephania yunnanensis TaxID=152371 RepID=A0AAP0ISD6_9MAGN
MAENQSSSSSSACCSYSSCWWNSSTWWSKLWASARRVRDLNDFSPAQTLSVDEDAVMVRKFGAIDLVLLGVGATIGSGIFVLTGTVASTAGPGEDFTFSSSISPHVRVSRKWSVSFMFVKKHLFRLFWLIEFDSYCCYRLNARSVFVKISKLGVVLSFLLAGAVSMLNALCYAELASRFPAVIGGSYMYAYTAFNELTAFLTFAQILPDCHVGAASIARSLSSYLVEMLELLPAMKGKIPSWMGVGGKELFGGAISINILAPILLLLFTVLLCWGVEESSALNSFMTVIKVVILLAVIVVGSFEIDVSNWSPFAPNGSKAILSGATIVFFAYLGFDAVPMSAEESKRPHRDLPIGILGSLFICAILYIGVCLVITGMVPYKLLAGDAPLAEAFTLKGLKYFSILISIGSISGLTTTLLINLYAQARTYVVLGRDGLLPSIFAKIHPTSHTPVPSQVWVGVAAAILAGLFNVDSLSQTFTVGSLIGYAVVCACLVTLRWEEKAANQGSTKWLSNRQEGVICLIAVSCCGFGIGLCFRYSVPYIVWLVTASIAVLAHIKLHYCQDRAEHRILLPTRPLLASHRHFLQHVLVCSATVCGVVEICYRRRNFAPFYAFYGQYHAKLARLNGTTDYHSLLAESS